MKAQTRLESEGVSGAESSWFGVLVLQDSMVELLGVLGGDWDFETVLARVAAAADKQSWVAEGGNLNFCVIHEVELIEIEIRQEGFLENLECLRSLDGD